MSKREGCIVTLEPEEPQRCQLCGTFAETRPYGPGGKRVCFKCGMLDESRTLRHMRQRLFGEKPQ